MNEAKNVIEVTFTSCDVIERNSAALTTSQVHQFQRTQEAAMSLSFLIFFPVGSWANKNEKHFKQLSKKEELHRVGRAALARSPQKPRSLSCEPQVLFFSCASFAILDVGIFEMAIVSITCSEDGLVSLLMDTNPFDLMGSSADRETFICIKCAALFGRATWSPVGEEADSAVMLISDEWVPWCQRRLQHSTGIWGTEG